VFCGDQTHVIKQDETLKRGFYDKNGWTCLSWNNLYQNTIPDRQFINVIGIICPLHTVDAAKGVKKIIYVCDNLKILSNLLD